MRKRWQLYGMADTWELAGYPRGLTVVVRVKQGKRHYRLLWSRINGRFVRSQTHRKAEAVMGGSAYAAAVAFMVSKFPNRAAPLAVPDGYVKLTTIAPDAANLLADAWDVYARASARKGYVVVLLRRARFRRLGTANAYSFLWCLRDDGAFKGTRDLRRVERDPDADMALDRVADILRERAAFLPHK